MNHNQPVKVILRYIEKFQMFLLTHLKYGQELADTNLVLYSLINLNKTGGMYTKALEYCNAKELTNCKTCST